MKMRMLLLLPLAVCAGCASYRWTSAVPAEMRTVCVPEFRNAADATELGPVVTQQILREFQREGTFKIARRDDAALELQGEILSVALAAGSGDRVTHRRVRDYVYELSAKISVVDRRAGKVLVDGRLYRAETNFSAGNDLLTAQRDASGRLADDLARQVIDDLVSLRW